MTISKKGNKLRYFLVLTSMTCLFACGGGGGSSPPPGEAVNVPPVVNAGNQVSVEEGEPISVTGTVNDPDGSITSITWTQVSGPIVALEGANTETVTFVAPVVTENTELTLQLTSSDDDGDTASDEVTIEILRKNVDVTLEGKVTDGPIPGSEVTVTIGDETFTAIADDNGDYSLVISVDDSYGSQMVVATAKGSGEFGMVEFVSFMGSLNALSEQANSEGMLDNISANITNISTATSVLLSLANNGNPIGNDSDLMNLERMIDGNTILKLAAVIKLVVDHPNFDLPAGFANTLEFISNEQAVESFIGDVANIEPTALADTIDTILEDSNLVTAPPTSSIAGVYYLTGVGQIFNPDWTQVLTLNENGTGSSIRHSAKGEQILTWEISAEGKLEMVFPGINSECTELETGILFDCVQNETIEVVVLNDGENVDLWYLNVSVESVDPEGVIASSIEKRDISTSAISSEGIVSFNPAELDGTFVEAFISTNSPEGNSHQFTMGEGNSGELMLADGNNLPLTWSVDLQGILAISVAENDENVPRQTQIVAVDNEGLLTQTLVIHGDSSSGDRSLSWGYFTPKDSNVAFTEDELTGYFELFYGRSNSRDGQFFLQFDTDHTGYQEFSSLDGESYSAPFSWGIDSNGKLKMDYFVSDSLGRVASCDIGIDGCYIQQIRIWDLIQKEGDRYYLDNFQQFFDPDGLPLNMGESQVRIFNKLSIRESDILGQHLLVTLTDSLLSSGSILELQNDGNGIYTTNDIDDEVTWSINSGVLELNIINPTITAMSFPYSPCNGIGQARQDTSLSSTKFILASGEGKTRWNEIQTWVDHFPDGECPDVLTTREFTGQRLLSQNDLQPMNVTAGNYALARNRMYVGRSYSDTDRVNLIEGGTGSALDSHEGELEWSTTDKGLVVNYANGDQLEYFGAIRNLGVGHLAFNVISVDGKRRTGVNMVLNYQTDLTFDETTVLGRFAEQSNFAIGPSDFAIQFNSNGLGGAEFTEGFGFNWNWEIENGGVRARRWWMLADDNGDGLPDDENGNGVPDTIRGQAYTEEEFETCAMTPVLCQDYNNRIYIPIAMDGDRYYLLRYATWRFSNTDKFSGSGDIFSDDRGTLFAFDKQADSANQLLPIISEPDAIFNSEFDKAEMLNDFSVLREKQRKLKLKSMNYLIESIGADEIIH